MDQVSSQTWRTRRREHAGNAHADAAPWRELRGRAGSKHSRTRARGKGHLLCGTWVLWGPTRGCHKILLLVLASVSSFCRLSRYGFANRNHLSPNAHPRRQRGAAVSKRMNMHGPSQQSARGERVGASTPGTRTPTRHRGESCGAAPAASTAGRAQGVKDTYCVEHGSSGDPQGAATRYSFLCWLRYLPSAGQVDMASLTVIISPPS